MKELSYRFRILIPSQPMQPARRPAPFFARVSRALRVTLMWLIYIPVSILFDLFYIRAFLFPYRWLTRGDPRYNVVGLRAWAAIMVTLLRTICGVRFIRYGDLPTPGGVVLVVNHQSMLDIPAVLHALVATSKPHFVLKHTLKYGLPIISAGSRVAGMAFVHRGKGAAYNREQIAALARRVEPEQISVVIYPEGTRTRDGHLRTFKTGGLNIIAESTNADIIPVVVEGLWPSAGFRGMFRNLPNTTVRFRCGDRIPMSRYRDDPTATLAEIRAFMLGTIAAMRREDGDPTTPRADGNEPIPHITLPPAQKI